MARRQAASPAGRKGYHHGDLRRALLTAAAAALETGGPEALSLRGVARRAGVSPAAPYRHFADREALLSALAAEAFEAFRAALATADQGAAAGHEVEAQAVAYVRFARSAPARFRLMFGPRRVVMDDALAAAKRAAFAVLQRRVHLQHGPDGDARVAAVGLWSFAHGLAILFLDGRVRDDLDEATKRHDDDEIVRRVTAATLGPHRRR